jgi:hypothetical protein
MNPITVEFKQVACIKQRAVILQQVAKSEGFTDFKPTNSGKVIQKTGWDSLIGSYLK